MSDLLGPVGMQWINESLARIRRFRPLWKDEYSLGPVLPLEDIEAFELIRRCLLPEDFREFLLYSGNGGAGPDYGLVALGQHFPGSNYADGLEEVTDLSKPFPHREAWNNIEEANNTDEDGRYFSPEHIAGSMIIGDRGCALWTLLVVTGPSAGEIWLDDRADGRGLRPHIAPNGSHYQFLRWYGDWLRGRLHQFGHEGPPRPFPNSES